MYTAYSLPSIGEAAVGGITEAAGHYVVVIVLVLHTFCAWAFRKNKDFTGDDLVLAVVQELLGANVMQGNALIPEICEMLDKRQMSEMTITIAPGGHGEDKRRRIAEL